MIKVYVASKAKHGPMWHQYREAWRALDVEIVSSWIDEYEPSATYDYKTLWVRCIDEAGNADLLIAYHEPGEIHKGLHIEVGAALRAGKPVYIVGEPPPGSWVNHPLVIMAFDADEAIDEFIRDGR